VGGVLRLVFDAAALHIGPMRVEAGDVFGGTVNFAARVVGAVKDAEVRSSRRKEAPFNAECGV
jgi:class 3 adenylate cyclase